MRGRPSHYTAAIADRILTEMTRDRPLGAICRDPGMPPIRTVYQWIRDDREGFAARFRACRQATGAKVGRPTAYRPERADHIAGGLIGGRSLKDVCRDPGMPTPTTVCNWAVKDRDGFGARYLDGAPGRLHHDVRPTHRYRRQRQRRRQRARRTGRHDAARPPTGEASSATGCALPS